MTLKSDFFKPRIKEFKNVSEYPGVSAKTNPIVLLSLFSVFKDFNTQLITTTYCKYIAFQKSFAAVNNALQSNT